MSKSHLSRRQFMNRSLAAAGVGAGFAIGGTKSSGRVIGANDTVRVAVAGLNGRGGEHVDQFVEDAGRRDHVPGRSRHPDVQEAARPDREEGRPRAGHGAGHPPRARRQVGRRRLGRHAQSLARLDHDLGLPGGQGRLRRKTVQPQRPRRPDRRRGRAAVQPDRPARHAEPLQPRLGLGRRGDPVGQARQAAGVSRPVLQAARQHRRQTEHDIRPSSSISTSGSARPRSSRITPTWSITTGTGSGTSATATSATRASTRWTSPAG